MLGLSQEQQPSGSALTGRPWSAGNAGSPRRIPGIARRSRACSSSRQRNSTRQGQIDGAAARLLEAADVIERTWSGGGLAIVFAAGRELRPWCGEPAVREARDRLFALMTAA